MQKVSICDTNQQVQGRATTGEASEYLKKTSVRDLLVMSYGTRQSSETMSLTVKITALWALKVALEEVGVWIWPAHPRARSKHQTFAKPRR